MMLMERLERLADSRLLYRFKRPWRDGTTHIVLEPLEMLEKLAALVPAPKAHLVRYSGLPRGFPCWLVGHGGVPRNRYRRPFNALLPHYRPLYALLWCGSQNQLGLGTNDFHVSFGHLMVEMTARLFLKRQPVVFVGTV